MGQPELIGRLHSEIVSHLWNGRSIIVRVPFERCAFHIWALTRALIEGESPFLQTAAQIGSPAGGNIREGGWIPRLAGIGQCT